MAHLSFEDKEVLRQAFQRREFGVLELKNKEFATFFRDMDIDIDDPRYQTDGTSQYLRLTRLCEIEDSSTVAMVLEALLSLDNKRKRILSERDIENIRLIVHRLRGDHSTLPAKSSDLFDSSHAKVNMPTPQGHLSIPTVSQEVIQRIWKDRDRFKVFISHKDAHKKDAQDLKDALAQYDIATFVAHTDIEPGTPWKDEILTALRTMDVFVAYLTSDFDSSPWTNQEVGFACALEEMGRIKECFLYSADGTDPKGFYMGRQAFKAGRDSLIAAILKLKSS